MGSSHNLVLTITEATETTVQGEVTWLGSSKVMMPFQGVILEDQVTFATNLPGAGDLIWQGTISGSALSGTCLFCCDNPNINPSLEPQALEWSCKLVRPAGDINPINAQHVWVHNDGIGDGPFTADEFKKYVSAGRWHSKSIVGLNDRTEWTTTVEYWIVAQQSSTPLAKSLPYYAGLKTVLRRIRYCWESLRALTHGRNRRKSPRRKVPKMTKIPNLAGVRPLLQDWSKTTVKRGKPSKHA